MRLPPIDEHRDANAAEVFSAIKETRGTVSHVLRSLGHAPEGLRAFAAYGEYVRYRSGLNGRLRELVILALARGNQYAWTINAFRIELEPDRKPLMQPLGGGSSD